MMERLLRKDLWLKIFSVALSILLWAMVMQDYSAENSRTLEVPLAVKPHPSFEVEEGPSVSKEQTVEVRLVGKNLIINRIREEDISAEIDYSRFLEPGRTYQVDVRILHKEKPPQNFQYSVNPKTVSVTLVESQEAQVSLLVEPATGMTTFEGADYQYTARAPQQALVTGRSDFLARVARAKVTLDATDLLPTTQTVTKRVIPLDAAGNPVDKLKVTFVDVQLDWKRLPPGKSVDVKPITGGAPPEGYAVVGIEVSPLTVMLRAATVDGKLPESEHVETAAISLVNQTRSFTIPVKLMPPSGTTVSVESVTATVTIGETTAERFFRGVPLVVTGKPPNLDVSLSVTEVQVRLKGPFTVVSAVNPATLSAFVNVENLAEGKHLLPVRINPPPGLTGEVIDPPNVEVTLIAP